MKYLNLVMCLLFLFGFLVACSSPEENAQKELQEKGVAVTADALVAQAKEGNVGNVQLLLAAGVSANSTGENGYSALAMAASSGQTVIIDVLLAAGADKDKIDRSGDTALIRSVTMGQEEAAVALVKAGARSAIINKKGESALNIAIKNRNWPMVIALGKAGVNLDDQDNDGRTLLLDAIDDGEEKTELAEALISGGAKFNIADNLEQTPFTAAVNQNQFKLVALMAEKGADVNAVLYKNKTYSALMQAIEMKSVELVRVLVAAGADVNFMVQETRDSCLYRAVYNKQKDIVELLIKAGADVNIHNIFQDTPLSRAAVDQKGQNLEIVDVLLEAGADINAVVTENGRTSLHLAAINSDKLPGSLDLLLKKGAAANLYDNEGNTPLTLAVLQNKIEAVVSLIEAGVDVDFPAMNGNTPLFIAEKFDYYKIAGKLRKAGATKK